MSRSSIWRTTEVKSAVQHPFLTKSRDLTLRLGSRRVGLPAQEQREGLVCTWDGIGAAAVAMRRVPGSGPGDDRRCPYDEGDEATAGPSRSVDIAPTATTFVVCSTGRDPMSTVSVEVAAW